jgi:hypothetical protein
MSCEPSNACFAVSRCANLLPWKLEISETVSKQEQQQRNSRETKGDYICVYCIQPKECSNIVSDPKGESLMSKILGGMHKEKCG